MGAANAWPGLLGLTLCSVGVYGGYGVFWSLVSGVLPDRHRPVGIALIHAFGTVGAMCSPVVIGLLRDLTGNFGAGFGFAAAMLVLAVVMVMIASRDPRRIAVSASGGAGAAA